MQYEYVIRCQECASHAAQGGLAAPAALSDAEVLAKLTHNAGCPVGLATYNPEREVVQVDQHEEEGEPSVTGYVIRLVPTLSGE